MEMRIVGDIKVMVDDSEEVLKEVVSLISNILAYLNNYLSLQTSSVVRRSSGGKMQQCFQHFPFPFIEDSNFQININMFQVPHYSIFYLLSNNVCLNIT